MKQSDERRLTASVISNLQKNTKDAACTPISDVMLGRLQKMESVVQLSGGLGHDFNNALQNIVTSLELVRKLIAAGRAGEAERFIAVAIEAARRAARANQLLLGYAVSPPAIYERATTGEVVSAMAELFSGAIPRSINLILDIASDTRSIYCDVKQLQQALISLMLNAREAIEDSGTITVRTRNITSAAETAPNITPGQYVEITVADNGRGMNEHTLSHAFDPYFTTEANATRSGLGLTIMERFVRQHHGHVQIDSAQHQGTSVRLYLPLRGTDDVENHART